MEMMEVEKGPIVAGVDIGGTKIAVGLMAGDGTVLIRTDTPTHVERGPHEALARIVGILRKQMQETGREIAGIGIGCTGPVDPISGEMGDVNTLPGWQGWNPVLQLSTEMGVSVAMENDADAALLGEARGGDGQERSGKWKRNQIFVTVGTGIGGGILLDGKIYRGARGCHPEVGHIILEPSGPLCTCGAYGCWESLAAGPAIEQWFATTSGGLQLNAKQIFVRAREGDAIARSAVQREARYLGLGLANLISTLMPEAIVLGGSVMQSADLMLDDIRAVIERNCRVVPYKFCEISLSSLGADAGLIGAAEVWHHRFNNAGDCLD